MGKVKFFQHDRTCICTVIRKYGTGEAQCAPPGPNRVKEMIKWLYEGRKVNEDGIRRARALHSIAGSCGNCRRHLQQEKYDLQFVFWKPQLTKMVPDYVQNPHCKIRLKIHRYKPCRMQKTHKHSALAGLGSPQWPLTYKEKASYSK